MRSYTILFVIKLVASIDLHYNHWAIANPVCKKTLEIIKYFFIFFIPYFNNYKSFLGGTKVLLLKITCNTLEKV